jgi:UDP-GlcNAc:undecaprenyl-phosphate GlcNAc-1-phosphate transferase
MITWDLLFSFLIFYSLFLIVIKVGTDFTFRLFKKNDCVSINFRGESIVQSFGLNLFLHYFLFLCFFHFFCFLVYDTSLVSFESFVLILLIFSLTIIGWVDDHYGTEQIKGLKGHFQAFIFHFQITSGLIKACMGTVIALAVSYPLQTSLVHWLFLSAVLVFSIHFFNLLDVRPGRSVKGFWLFLFFIVSVFTIDQLMMYVIPVLLSTYVLFRYDRSRMAMLGDTGSNVLGGIFGFYLLYLSQIQQQIIFLSVFLLLSLISERHSFTAYINKTPWLSKLDNWGIR